MITNLVKSTLVKSSLTRGRLPTIAAIRTSFTLKSGHLYGVERIQYLTGKRKAIIKEEYENIAVLEDQDMLGVYLMKRVKRMKTTPDKPIYVPAMGDSRLICCHCDVDGLDLTYTMLEKNKIIACDCGYHFKLIDHLDPFAFTPKE